MKQKRGFTLIELIVVITISLILTTIAMVSYTGVQARARDGRRIADVEKIRQALEMYRQKNSVYPTQSQLLASGYLKAWPADPRGASYAAYVYQQNTNYTYTLSAYVEDLGSTNSTPTGSCGGSPVHSCNYVVTNP